MTGPDDWTVRLNTKMFPTIDAWMKRFREETPSRVELRSSLAEDDARLPVLPLSLIAHNTMLTAVEHLDLFRASLKAMDGAIYTAHATLLRTALMGSAQAVWVLAPRTQEERLVNAVKIAADSCNQRRKMANEAIDQASEMQPNIHDQERRLADYLNEVKKVADELNLNTKNIEKWPLNMTTIINEATEFVHAHDTEGAAEIRLGSRLLWRRLSGYAHAVPTGRWDLIKPGDTITQSDGLSHAQVGFDVDDIGTQAAAPFLLVNEAWRLYDLRRIDAR